MPYRIRSEFALFVCQLLEFHGQLQDHDRLGRMFAEA